MSGAASLPNLLPPLETLPPGSYLIIGFPTILGQSPQTFGAVDPVLFVTAAQLAAAIKNGLLPATSTVAGVVKSNPSAGLVAATDGTLSLNGNGLPTTPGVTGSGTPWNNGGLLAFS